MQVLHHDAVCSACGNGRLERITRESWMHWLPRAKHYRCRSCKTRFLQFLNGISVRLPGAALTKSPSKKGAFNQKQLRLIVLILAVLGCMYIARSCAIREYENSPQAEARSELLSEETETIRKT